MATSRRTPTPNQNTALDSSEFENKDLAPAVAADDSDAPTETPEPAVAPEPRMEGIEVKMLNHYTHEGKNLPPGEVVELPPRLAANLVAGHFAEYV